MTRILSIFYFGMISLDSRIWSQTTAIKKLSAFWHVVLKFLKISDINDRFSVSISYLKWNLSSHISQNSCHGLSSEEVLGTHVSRYPSFQMQGDGRVIRRKCRRGVTSHFSGFWFLVDSMLKAVKSEEGKKCSILSVHD